MGVIIFFADKQNAKKTSSFELLEHAATSSVVLIVGWLDGLKETFGLKNN